jgi:hypothetical protein
MLVRVLSLIAVVALVARPVVAQTAADCNLPKADRAVAGITLGNADSAIRVLGRTFTPLLDDPKSDYPWLIFASRGNRQLLLLRHHAGDLEHSYMEAEVKFGRHDKKPDAIPVFDFTTGGGIKLGLKRRQVVSRLGPCFKSDVKNGNEIIRYEIKKKDGAPDHPLLKSANMPEYYAEYEFHGSTLVRFRFGYGPV